MKHKLQGVFAPNSKHRVQVTPAKPGKGKSPKHQMSRKRPPNGCSMIVDFSEKGFCTPYKTR